MKTVKLSLALIACTVMTACGSSGSGEQAPLPNNTATSNNSLSQNQNNAVTNAVTNNDSSTSNEANNASSSINSSHTGNAIIVKGMDREATVTNAKLSDPSLSQIRVEGRDIQIAYPGILSGGWSDMSVGNTDLYVCCGKYSDTKFGISEGGYDGNTYFFHNGNATKNMPTTGTATYNGHVIITGETSHFDDEDYLKGTSQFTADFANKKLYGEFNIDTMEAVNIDAHINSNDFSGTASSNDFETSAKVEGKFYGDKAKELSGVFHDGATWGGAFGASQAK